MAHLTLTADSGSTKTDWLLAGPGHGVLEVRAAGINPARDSRDAILRVLRSGLLPRLPRGEAVDEVRFYGAGCAGPFRDTVAGCLREVFPRAEVSAESDLMGAARALCGDREGVACILGTGANSCLYDGRGVRLHTPPLGYILGDEGSGAALGKALLTAALRGELPPEAGEALLAEYRLDEAEAIGRVYRQPRANVFLASLVPFLAARRGEDFARGLLVGSFRQFLARHTRPYGRPDLPISFVGGVAATFTDELREAARLEGLTLGEVLRSPIRRIALYHQRARD